MASDPPPSSDLDCSIQELAWSLRALADLDYLTARTAAFECKRAFHEILSKQLTSKFSGHFGALPCRTLADRKKILHEANSDLVGLGLALANPHSGEPSALEVSSSPIKHNGFFRLCQFGERTPLLSSTAFPSLALVPRSINRPTDDGGHSPPGSEPARRGRIR